MAGVTVDFNANTARFTEGVNKATSNLNKFRADAEKAGKAIGLAIVAAGTATAYLVKQSIDNADAMSKMAQSTGIAIDKLTGLSYAANLSGVEADAFASAMVKLTKGMGDAAVGTGEALRGFNALGINIKDSAGNLKNADVILSEVSGKFAGMEDGANKTALAVALFGKSGADMIPVLNSGSDGLKSMHAEAAKLGLVLDSETGQAAERFNDNLTRLNAVKTGFSNQIMKEMLPSLERLSVAMLDAATNSNALTNAMKIGRVAFEAIIVLSANVKYVFEQIGIEIGGIVAQLAALGKGDFKQFAFIGKQMKEDAAKAREEIDRFSEEIINSSRKVESTSAEVAKKFAAPMMKSLGEINKAKKQIKRAFNQDELLPADVLDQLFNDQSAWAAKQKIIDKDREDALNKQEESAENLRSNALEAQQILFDVDPIARATHEWEKLTDLVEKGLLSQENAGKKFKKEFGDDLDQMGIYAKRFADNVQRSLGDVLYDGLNGKFDNIADAFKQMLLRMAADAAAAQLTQKMFGNMATTGEAGGWVGDLLNIAATVGGGGGSTKVFANGGVFDKATPFKFANGAGFSNGILGEAGPEAVMPLARDRSGKLGVRGGGASINYAPVINIDSRTDRAEVQRLVSGAVKQGNAELVDKLQRAGALA